MRLIVFSVAFIMAILLSSAYIVYQLIQLYAHSVRVFSRTLFVFIIILGVYAPPVVITILRLQHEKPTEMLYGITWGMFYMMLTLSVFQGIIALGRAAYKQGLGDGKNVSSTPPK